MLQVFISKIIVWNHKSFLYVYNFIELLVNFVQKYLALSAHNGRHLFLEDMHRDPKQLLLRRKKKKKRENHKRLE